MEFPKFFPAVRPRTPASRAEKGGQEGQGKDGEKKVREEIGERAVIACDSITAYNSASTGHNEYLIM